MMQQSINSVETIYNKQIIYFYIIVVEVVEAFILNELKQQIKILN